MTKKRLQKGTTENTTKKDKITLKIKRLNNARKVNKNATKKDVKKAFKKLQKRSKKLQKLKDVKCDKKVKFTKKSITKKDVKTKQ